MVGPGIIFYYFILIYKQLITQQLWKYCDNNKTTIHSLSSSSKKCKEIIKIKIHSNNAIYICTNPIAKMHFAQ